MPAPTGADKTTVVLYQREDHAGGLLELLEQFAARGINMTRLESRPMRGALWQYVFYLEVDGHSDEEPVAAALADLRDDAVFSHLVGSYPRVD